MKRTLRYGFRQFLYTLFIAFSSFTVTVSFGVILKDHMRAFYVLSQLFSFIIMVVLIWQTVYDIGFRDSNMVRTGHMKEDLPKGFKIGAVSQLPWAVFFIVSVMLNIKFSVYRIINSLYWSFLTLICGVFDGKRLAQLTMQDLSVLKLGGIALLFFIIPIISGSVYILGYKGIDIFSLIIYKKRKGK